MDFDVVQRDAGERFDAGLELVGQAGVVLARDGIGFRPGARLRGRTVVHRCGQLALGGDVRTVVQRFSQLAQGEDIGPAVRAYTARGGLRNPLGVGTGRSVLDSGFRLVLHRGGSHGLDRHGAEAASRIMRRRRYLKNESWGSIPACYSPGDCRFQIQAALRLAKNSPMRSSALRMFSVELAYDTRT